MIRRHWIQSGVFLVVIAIGIQFAIHVHQVRGDGIVSVPRPPGVEGFLPIGALMGWKLFVTHGIWDNIHPAAMVILGFAVVLSFFIRKAFCGWFCPVGTLSEWLWRLGLWAFGKNIRLPGWADLPLRGLKYLILGFFVWIICINMDGSSIMAFMNSPYYKIADVRMLDFFISPSLFTVLVMVVLIVGSVFIQNFWCRYLCPYGALLGLFSLSCPSC